MDPITGIIVAGLMTMALFKTAGSTVTDLIAQNQGKTPPSLEKWRDRNQARAKHGHTPRREPGPMWRRMQNAFDGYFERGIEKGRAKREGKLAHLQQTRPDKVEAARARKETWERRRKNAGEKVGHYVGLTAEGIRLAVSPNERRERAAWQEKQRRDNEGSVVTDPNPSQSEMEASDAGVDGTGEQVAPNQHAVWPPTESGHEFAWPPGHNRVTWPDYPNGPSNYWKSKLETANGQQNTDLPGQEELVARWRSSIESGVSDPGIMTAKEWNSLPSETRDMLIAETKAKGASVEEKTDDGTVRRLGKNHLPSQDDLLARLRSAKERGGSATVSAEEWNSLPPETRDMLIAECEATGGFVQGTEDDGTVRKPEENHSPDEQHSNNTPETAGTTEGTNTMTAMHSGEINSLADAQAFTETGVSVCDQISGTFENSEAQATTTVQDLERMLASIETGQSSLAGQGLNEAAGIIGGANEALAAMRNSVQEVQTLLASAKEAIGQARANLADAGQKLSAQQGIAEEVSAHSEVAENTSFYTNA